MRDFERIFLKDGYIDLCEDGNTYFGSTATKIMILANKELRRKNPTFKKECKVIKKIVGGLK